MFSGQPYPELDGSAVPLHRLPSLDMFRTPDPCRPIRLRELHNWIDWTEWLTTCTGAFAEPLAFSLRAFAALRSRIGEFDLVHDNQCLGYGIGWLRRAGLPVLSTIHHPITVDRRVEVAHAASLRKRFDLHRFYSFTRMQSRVASRLDRLLTVSQNSFDDIVADHRVPAERLHVVPVGADVSLFRPLAGVAPVPGRLMTTASADISMKGLVFLLEAVAKLRTENPQVHLVVIGKSKDNSAASKMLAQTGLEQHVEFVSGVDDQRIVELYNQAQLAVVPSLYEGFSLPAIEAMACGVPLVATTGGALPEVTGPDGETCLQVPPGDADALAAKIGWALQQPDLRDTIGVAAMERVRQNFTWSRTAERTAEHYRAMLDETEHNRTSATREAALADR